jgi:hypothetical protein
MWAAEAKPGRPEVQYGWQEPGHGRQGLQRGQQGPPHGWLWLRRGWLERKVVGHGSWEGQD